MLQAGEVSAFVFRAMLKIYFGVNVSNFCHCYCVLSTDSIRDVI